MWSTFLHRDAKKRLPPHLMKKRRRPGNFLLIDYVVNPLCNKQIGTQLKMIANMEPAIGVSKGTRLAIYASFFRQEDLWNVGQIAAD